MGWLVWGFFYLLWKHCHWIKQWKLYKILCLCIADHVILARLNFTNVPSNGFIVRPVQYYIGTWDCECCSSFFLSVSSLRDAIVAVLHGLIICFYNHMQNKKKLIPNSWFLVINWLVVQYGKPKWQKNHSCFYYFSRSIWIMMSLSDKPV